MMIIVYYYHNNYHNKFSKQWENHENPSYWTYIQESSFLRKFPAKFQKSLLLSGQVLAG
jgi:hypothetical protein